MEGRLSKGGSTGKTRLCNEKRGLSICNELHSQVTRAQGIRYKEGNSNSDIDDCSPNEKNEKPTLIKKEKTSPSWP